MAFTDNDTGYKPPPKSASVDSLPTTLPLPGPEILYWPLARSVQLENTWAWKAQPLMVSGASAYRGGEFIYQDFLYDDLSLKYPAEPAKYAANAADLVEVRMKPMPNSLAIRLSYNTMIDPEVAATTIALGSPFSPKVSMPHGAGASMPADVFVTVHGCTAELVRADGAPLASAARVAVNAQRRQVHIEVPYAVFDPRGKTAVRVAAASGLWNTQNNQYQRPDTTKPAFFNVGYRFNEPVTGMRESRQTAALATGDLSEFYANVDFLKLAAGGNDDMAGQFGGVPQTGAITRILVSHFEPDQGRGTGVSPDVDYSVADYHRPSLVGRLQPYTIDVPAGVVPASPAGWGLDLARHGCGDSHASNWQHYFGKAGARSSIGVATESRGECQWEVYQTAADMYEVWADLAHRYKLDADKVTLSGLSMGGYATWKNIVQFPDLFTAAAPRVAPATAAGAHLGPLLPPINSEPWMVVYQLLPSLRHVPVVHWVGISDELVPFLGTQPISDMLDALGYRHSFWAFAGEHLMVGLLLSSYEPELEYIRNRPLAKNPAHVSYVFNPTMSQPQWGMSSDHAYWLSGFSVRERTAAAPLATIDVVSRGFGATDAPVVGPVTLPGVYSMQVPTSADPAISPLLTGILAGSQVTLPLPYSRTDVQWGAPGTADVANALDVKVTNLSTLTIHVDRAAVTCDAQLNVQSDGPIEIVLKGKSCERRLNF